MSGIALGARAIAVKTKQNKITGTGRIVSQLRLFCTLKTFTPFFVIYPGIGYQDLVKFLIWKSLKTQNKQTELILYLLTYNFYLVTFYSVIHVPFLL